MSNKQSNKQTQSVKVVVNNKVSCNPCEKKKKKPRRKQQPQQPEQPVDEFPALDTQVNTRYPQMGIAPMAVRNTVYIPNSSQISPEGMQYPIPPYFDRQYTNLTRTMEDFRDSMVKEIDDVRQTIAMRPPTMTNNTQTYIPTDPILEEQQSTSPVKSMINRFENFGSYDDQENYNTMIQEEEPLVSKSPEQSRVIDDFTRLYSAWEQTANYSNERKVALDEIRSFAQELGLDIISTTTNKPKSAQQLRADIRKQIKEMN